MLKRILFLFALYFICPASAWAQAADDFPPIPASEILHSSDLPIIKINTNGAHIVYLPYQPDTKPKVNATISIISNDEGNENHLTDSPAHYKGNISIGLHGNSSLLYPQKSYTIDLKDLNWKDMDSALLGMPAEEDWVLIAPWYDKSLIRNAFTYRLSNDIGRYAARSRFCELVINDEYMGVYTFGENIKRGSDRVAINKMDADDTLGEELTGGYILEVDRMGDDAGGFVSRYPSCKEGTSFAYFGYEYPKPANITTAQRRYITDYIGAFEAALPYSAAYRGYIDVPSFIDHTLMQELSSNTDAYRFSSYFYKPRNGKLMAGPVWDFNFGYGNADHFDSYPAYDLRWEKPCHQSEHNPYLVWWDTFTADPVFMSELKKRYISLRQTLFSDQHIIHLIDSLAGTLAGSQERHYARWPIFGLGDSPNAHTVSWQEEIDYMRNWLLNRLQFLDTKLADKEPIFLYPNPASDNITIVAVGLVQEVAISNILGQTILEQAVNQEQATINISALPPGMYIVTARNSVGDIRTMKLWKQ